MPNLQKQFCKQATGSVAALIHSFKSNEIIRIHDLQNISILKIVKGNLLLIKKYLF